MALWSKIAAIVSFGLLASAQSNCKTVTFTATGTAQNRAVTGSLPTTLAALLAFYNALPLVTVNTPQNIAAVYCTPLVSNANNNKLQFLSGSITADHTEWSALGGVGSDFPQYKPDMYSWTLFANRLGYPTLAIDRLGTGRSSHPDPLTVVQAQFE